jgi:quercetin dioxygenase-like cupin family protein
MRTTTGSVLLAGKSFDAPDEVRRFEKGSLEVVNVAEYAVARATFAPGWHWAEHVGPMAGTRLCQAEHLGYIVSGRMQIRMEDGSEAEFGAGEVFTIKPHHDAWVLGKEPCVVLDFVGALTYAEP